jgi:hypothetical protein
MAASATWKERTLYLLRVGLESSSLRPERDIEQKDDARATHTRRTSLEEVDNGLVWTCRVGSRQRYATSDKWTLEHGDEKRGRVPLLRLDRFPPPTTTTDGLPSSTDHTTSSLSESDRRPLSANSVSKS